MNEVIDMYKKAVEQWSEEKQILMVIEEISELFIELFHYLRGRGKRENIIEEIADVSIMLDQLKW